MPLSVEVIGLDKFVRDAKDIGANAPTVVKGAIFNSVNKIQSEARQRAAHRTGTLQRSILTSVDYPVGQVHVEEKYGVFIEEGTGIYGKSGQPITPKKAKVLAWSKGGNMVFAKRVKGMRAKPFFKPGIEASAEYISEQFAKVMDIFINALKGH